MVSLWHEMKPLVKFAFKALGIIAGALIAIVRAIPKHLQIPLQIKAKSALLYVLMIHV